MSNIKYNLNENEKLNIAIGAMYFFGRGAEKAHQTIGINHTPGSPPSFANFLKWLEKDQDIKNAYTRFLGIYNFVLKLEATGYLIYSGSNPSGSPPLNKCYHSYKLLSANQQKGRLFLTDVLGGQYLIKYLSRSIPEIKGINDKGIEDHGSGIFLSPDIVLTNAHVVNGLNDVSINVNSQTFKVKDKRTHKIDDVGFFLLEEKNEQVPADVTWDYPKVFDDIFCIGYPRMAAPQQYLISQKGEVNGFVKNIEGNELFIFSSIARPGNSGGPIFNVKGQVVGIVTGRNQGKYLDVSEEGKEDLMFDTPFSFAVPSWKIANALSDLGCSYQIEFE